jgi:tetratricopeptide (TPR) repeat protein
MKKLRSVGEGITNLNRNSALSKFVFAVAVISLIMVVYSFVSLISQDIIQNRLGFVIGIIALVFAFIVSINSIYKIIKNDENFELQLSLKEIYDLNNQYEKKKYIDREIFQIFCVPYPKNRFFVGREDSLSQLESAFKEPGHVRAIIGPSGVGTTQIALQYAYLQSKNYNLIFWIRSNQRVTLEEDYKILANKLGLIAEGFENVKAINEAVKSWLELNSSWLLIFDDAQDTSYLDQYIPKKIKGNIIITSCNSDIPNIANPQYVDLFNSNEALDFLIDRIGKIKLQDAENLINIIGRHPLSLELAVAYIKKTNISIKKYISYIKKRDVLTFNDPSYTKSIAVCLDISLKEIQKESAASIDILRLCSFFASGKVTKSMLINGLKSLAEKSILILLDIKDENDIILNVELLESYSLIQRINDGFIIHSLIQSAVRDGLTKAEKNRWIADAIKLINELFGENNNLYHILPHALAVSKCLEESNKDLDVAAELINKIGFYLFNKEDLEGAKSAFEKAIMISENNQQTVISNLDLVFYTLGEIQRDSGDTVDAKRNFEKSLKISEKTYGISSPIVARISQKLAMVLRDSGDFENAKKYIDRALEIDISQQNENNSIYNKEDIAYDYRVLGMILVDLGDADGAKEYLEKSQEIERKIRESSKFKNMLQNNSKMFFDEG